jgi:hypothetical protein
MRSAWTVRDAQPEAVVLIKEKVPSGTGTVERDSMYVWSKSGLLNGGRGTT